jgi:hypothetical protein
MKHLQNAKQDEDQLPVSSLHPFVSIYKTGRVSAQIPEMSLNNEPLKFSHDAADTKVIVDRGTIGDEIKYIRGLSAKAEDKATSETPLAHEMSNSANGKAQMTNQGPTRRVMQWQVARLCMLQEALSSSTQQLIDQFVLKHYPHPLVRKCWGTQLSIDQARNPLPRSQ